MLDDTRTIALNDPADMQRRVVELLRESADATGDPRYRVALGVVCGGRPGRRRCEDNDSIVAMQIMLQSGHADSVEQAARFVARGLPGERSEHAAIKRLASKYRQVNL